MHVHVSECGCVHVSGCGCEYMCMRVYVHVGVCACGCKCWVCGGMGRCTCMMSVQVCVVARGLLRTMYTVWLGDGEGEAEGE